MNIFGYFRPGIFLLIDLVVSGANALSVVLLARSSTHCRGNYWTVVGPAAGRYLIDVASRVSVKQFVQRERFIGVAIVASIAFLVSEIHLARSIWLASLVSVVVGFTFRMIAVRQGWEGLAPKMPEQLV